MGVSELEGFDDIFESLSIIFTYIDMYRTS